MHRQYFVLPAILILAVLAVAACRNGESASQQDPQAQPIVLTKTATNDPAVSGQAQAKSRIEAAVPGRVYTRSRSDSNYGEDSYIFLANPDTALFPLFSADPINAFRFASMTADEIAAQPLEVLAAGALQLRTNMAFGMNILYMKDLALLAEYYDQHLKGEDIYDLQGAKSRIVADLQLILGRFRSEDQKVRQTDFTFESRTEIREMDYDLDAGRLRLRVWPMFMPENYSNVSWNLKDSNVPMSPRLICDGPTIKATFDGVQGNRGERVLPATVKYWVRPTGGQRLESVYSTMADFVVEKAEISTQIAAGLRRIIIIRDGGNWQVTPCP